MTIKRQDQAKINDKKSSGYILPTILALSVIMMTTLVTSLSFTTAIRVSIKKQGYDKLTQLSKQAGIAYAEACVAKDPTNADEWTANKPLTPATKCDGEPLDDGGPISCTSDAGIEDEKCAVINDAKNNYRTSFAIDHAELDLDNKIIDISVNSSLGFTRKSSKKVWKKQINKGGYSRKTVESSIGWKQVSAGANHTCAIASNDKAYCWGFNNGNSNWGVLGDNSQFLPDSNMPIAVDTRGVLNGKKILSISAGFAYTCAVSDDYSLYCWGSNGGLNISKVPSRVSGGALAGKSIKYVSVGQRHSCALDVEGKAYCWGVNDNGQLGNDSRVGSPTPVEVNLMDNVNLLSIVVGKVHTCAVSTDKKAYCWGGNQDGQLGDSTKIDSLLPADISLSGPLNGKIIKSISTSMDSNSTCAVVVDSILGKDQAYCWGLNNSGQIGTGSTKPTEHLSPVLVGASGPLSSKSVGSVSVGSNHTCAIASEGNSKNSTYCWGNNLSGAVGIPYSSTNNSNTPSPTAVLSEDKQKFGVGAIILSSGTNHTCVVSFDGQIHCWGDNNNASDEENYGVLGNSSNKKSYFPVAVARTGVLSDKTIGSVAIGGYGHACAIDSIGELYCWGRNDKGQLGNDTRMASRTPVEVYVGTSDNRGSLYGKKVKSVSISRVNDSTCALTEDGQVSCWGKNNKGQLGDGTNDDSLVPNSISMDGLDGLSIKDVSMGGDFTCAIASDDKAYCWGQNSEIQLGHDNSDLVLSLEPIAVDDSGVLKDKALVSISAGRKHACALDSSGNAYCWGQNDFKGVLGNTAKAGYPISLPVKVDAGVFSDGKNIKAIFAGDSHTCAINSDDSQAYCWGHNAYGQLGSGDDNNSLIPKKVYSDILDGKTVKDMSINAGNGCLVASDTKVYCWGRNNFGQLGKSEDLSGDTHSVLVRVSDGLSIKNESIDNVSVGLYSNCVLSGGKVFCWGSNQHGQLGNNTTINSPLPSPIFTSLTCLQDFKFYR